MKLKFLAPIFAMTMAGACSDEPKSGFENATDKPTNLTKEESVQAQPNPISPMQQTGAGKSVIYPFDDAIDGKCFFYLTIISGTENSAKLTERFQTAKEYFEMRVYSQYNIDPSGDDYVDKLTRVLTAYRDIEVKQHGVINIGYQSEISLEACINDAHKGISMAEPSIQ